MKAVVCGAIFVAVAEAIAITTAGQKDQRAFLLWTVMGAVIAGILAVQFCRLSKNWHQVLGLLVSALTGAVIGFLWTFFVALFLGPWVGAFSMPILLCWTAGGSAAVFAAQALTRFKLLLAIPTVAVFSVAASFAVFGIPLAARRAANDQQILLFFLRYTPGDQVLVIRENPSSSSHEELLNDEEKRSLVHRYPRGLLKLEARWTHGSGPVSRAIIVVDRPVTQDVKLAQPDRGTVFYWQTADRFERHPSDAKVLNRFITLHNSRYESYGGSYVALGYMVDSWNGSATGGHAMRWKKEEIEP